MKETAPAISAGVSHLLTQEDLSWAKLKPKFQTEKQPSKADKSGGESPVTEEKIAVPESPLDIPAPAKNRLSLDQLLLPGLALVLLSLLAGYRLGQESTTAPTQKGATSHQLASPISQDAIQKLLH